MLHASFKNIYEYILAMSKAQGRRRRDRSTNFNPKVNKQQNVSKATVPNGRLLHKLKLNNNLKSRPSPLSSCIVVAPPFILLELLHGTRDRCGTQVKLISNHATGHAPFPCHIPHCPSSLVLDTPRWTVL